MIYSGLSISSEHYCEEQLEESLSVCVSIRLAMVPLREGVNKQNPYYFVSTNTLSFYVFFCVKEHLRSGLKEIRKKSAFRSRATEVGTRNIYLSYVS